MTKQTRLALLAVAAVAVTSSAQAQYVSGDLIVGFTSGSSGNDYLLDVGPASSLFNGETWSLGSTVQTILGTGNGVFGVIGSSTAPNTIYSTTLNLAPGTLASAQYNQVNAGIQAVAGNLSAASSATVASGGSTSWYTETDQPTGTPGSTLFFNTYHNPNVVLADAAELWSTVANNTKPAPTFLGDFMVSPNGGTLTFTVPEPATVSLAALGLLGLAVVRRRANKA